MAVFAVLLDNDVDPDTIKNRVETAFPIGNFRFGERVWFVSAPATTATQVSEKIGVKTGGTAGVAVIGLTASYWGVVNPGVWAWLKTNFEKSDV